MKKVMALGAVFAVLGIIAAGCGSSGSGSTGSTSEVKTSEETNSGGGGASAAVKGAEAKLAELTEEPPAPEIPPMKKPPVSHANIDFAGCPLPVCVAVEEGVKGAAKALGWSVKSVNLGLTPATVQSAWNAIAQDPPDGVLAATILPNEQISKQLEELNGVPYVGSSPGIPIEKFMHASVGGPKAIEGDGDAMASWVVRESGGEPEETIFVWDPSLAALIQSQEGYVATMKELCPECKVTELKVATADAGTKIPEEVVNEVRTHPEAKYVVLNLGDYAAGVPQALKAANLPQTPELVTRAASTTNMEQIKNGEMATALTAETVEDGWRMTDLLARLLNHEEPYEGGEPELERTFLTDENLPEDISVPFTVPGFEKIYEEAWGK